MSINYVFYGKISTKPKSAYKLIKQIYMRGDRKVCFFLWYIMEFK